MFYTNACGIVNKMHELRVIAELYEAKIICITESHLNSSIKNAEIKLNNFRVFRKDRDTGKKFGGSCIFVHNSIDAALLETFVAPDSVGINIKLDSLSLKLACVYRSQNLEENEQKLLIQQIANLKTGEDDQIQVVGDFNLPDVNWESITVNCNQNTTNTTLARILGQFCKLGSVTMHS